MTLYGLLASLAWTATAVFFVSRCDAFAARWLALKDTTASLPGLLKIPDDLQGFAMMESEKHAQESTLEAIRESYGTYQDWNKVRAAMGVAQQDRA